MTGDWRQQAACRGSDPTWFDPLDPKEIQLFGAHPTAHYRIQQAMDVCARCPVRDACDQWAEATKAVGVWAEKYRHKVPAGRSAGPVGRQRPKKAAA